VAMWPNSTRGDVKSASLMSILAAAVLNFALRDLSDPRLGLLGVRVHGKL
jgi:hypothetical protein